MQSWLVLLPRLGVFWRNLLTAFAASLLASFGSSTASAVTPVASAISHSASTFAWSEATAAEPLTLEVQQGRGRYCAGSPAVGQVSLRKPLWSYTNYDGTACVYDTGPMVAQLTIGVVDGRVPPMAIEAMSSGTFL